MRAIIQRVSEAKVTVNENITGAIETGFIPLYEYFLKACEKLTNEKPQTGIFGAMMEVELCNNGPVTIFMDSKNKA